MRRESWGTDIILNTIQVWGPLSESGVLVLPQTLYTGSISYLSWYLHRKICGVLLVWVGLLYTHIDCQKLQWVFFYQPSSFRRELPLWYSVRSTLVSPTTGLTWTLYNLFGSHYSVIFILNPIPVNLSKNICHISDNYYIYKEISQTRGFFLFFLIFLIFFFRMWTFKPKIYYFSKGYEETTNNYI